jgi:bifunctional NMN adenylyltransferase/nudix hydrolase
VDLRLTLDAQLPQEQLFLTGKGDQLRRRLRLEVVMTKRTLSARQTEPAYQYDVGLFTSKSEPVTLAHLGHALIMAKTCRFNVICVGSIDRARDPRFPFDFEERRQMWLASLPEEVRERTVIIGQRDIGNGVRWASAVDHKVTQAAAQVGIDMLDASAAIFGHYKDATSRYLDDFPGYELFNLPAYEGPDPALMQGDDAHLLSASDVRTGMFENGLTEREDLWLERCLVAVTPGVADIIKDFIHGSEFPRLQEEYRRAKAAAEPWKVRKSRTEPGLPYAINFTAVDPVVVHGNMVLMHQRDIYPGKDMWALPGVMLRADETVVDAAIRGLIEKTSIDLTAGDLRQAVVDQWFIDSIHRSIRERTISFPVLFQLGLHAKGRTAGDRLKARMLPRTKASARVGWFTPDEIETMRDQIHEDHAIIIDQALERLQPRF